MSFVGSSVSPSLFQAAWWTLFLSGSSSGPHSFWPAQLVWKCILAVLRKEGSILWTSWSYQSCLIPASLQDRMLYLWKHPIVYPTSFQDGRFYLGENCYIISHNHKFKINYKDELTPSDCQNVKLAVLVLFLCLWINIMRNGVFSLQFQVTAYHCGGKLRQEHAHPQPRVERNEYMYASCLLLSFSFLLSYTTLDPQPRE